MYPVRQTFRGLLRTPPMEACTARLHACARQVSPRTCSSATLRFRSRRSYSSNILRCSATCGVQWQGHSAEQGWAGRAANRGVAC